MFYAPWHVLYAGAMDEPSTQPSNAPAPDDDPDRAADPDESSLAAADAEAPEPLTPPAEEPSAPAADEPSAPAVDEPPETVVEPKAAPDVTCAETAEPSAEAEPAVAPAEAEPVVAPAEAESAVAPAEAEPAVAPIEAESAGEAAADAADTPEAATAPAAAPPAPDPHAAKAKENAQRLEAEIDRLRVGHREGTEHRYRAFFEHERRLHALFKELRPLHATDRHRLWNTFKQVGVEVRRAQQEEWESRRYQSIEAREAVEEKIRGAESLTLGAQGSDDYRKADTLLNEARALLASDSKDAPGVVLIGPDRRACWERWREVRDQLRQRRGGLQEQDYTSLAEPVAEVTEDARTGDPFKAIQRVKELQAQLGRAYLRRGQFEELRRRLSEAWQAAQARVSEQRQERSKHRAEWRERMEGHLGRWRETLGHKQSQREHLVAQLEKLEGMEKNSRSEEFTVQVCGWKDETADKLRRVDEFIADLDERIRSAAKKLGGRATRGPASPAAQESSAGGEAPAPDEGGAPPDEPEDTAGS